MNIFLKAIQENLSEQNLRIRLNRSGKRNGKPLALLVKELATISGISRRTIDNYLREEGSMPSADAAVRIAGALGVTVEYLITGHEKQERNHPPLSPDPRVVLKNLETLNKRDRKIVFNLIKSLREMEDQEKKA